LLYTLPLALRDQYELKNRIVGWTAINRVFLAWTLTFVALGVVGFLTKTTGLFSRGWLLSFFVFGFAVLVGLNFSVEKMIKRWMETGSIARRRVMLVCEDTDLLARLRSMDASYSNVDFIAAAILPGKEIDPKDEDFAAGLNQIVARARSFQADDILLVMDWLQPLRVRHITDTLMSQPTPVLISDPYLIGRVSDCRLERLGGLAALKLPKASLTPVQRQAKRIFDLIFALIAVVLLSPLLLAVGVLIRVDSPGPVFFRQRRRGFNQEEFRIWKFRTMSTLDDGDQIVQARQNDSRVTRVGRWLRKFNIDELPQLFNVVAGEMSLVGPRPHAVAHDKFYEQIIGNYPRRLNVPPGITGWAQVHGLRGPTTNEDAMRQRVAHDIEYIETWSLALDFYIIGLTVLSPRAYRNAF
jgi:Undecaprenyl-phosphate glucose phosphotransferase